MKSSQDQVECVMCKEQIYGVVCKNEVKEPLHWGKEATGKAFAGHGPMLLSALYCLISTL